MAGKAKATAREAFNDNIGDAHMLVLLADSLRNRRTRRMRSELRVKLGEALGIRKRDHDKLDCLESEHLFVVFKPNANVDRGMVSEENLRPLLRQALVAGCSAVETFIGDRVMERLRSAIDMPTRPNRLLDLPMTVGDWLRIEETYEKRRWGLREIVELEVRRLASPSPDQIGKTLGIVGERNLWKRIDAKRGVNKGDSERSLASIYERRNRIAHQGDRLGRGRAALTVEEVREDLDCLVDIVDAVDRVTSP